MCDYEYVEVPSGKTIVHTRTTDTVAEAMRLAADWLHDNERNYYVRKVVVSAHVPILVTITTIRK